MKKYCDLHLYIVDVCGTLVRDDTTLGLLKYHFAHTSRRRLRHIIFSLSIGTYSPVHFGFSVLERLTGKHLLKLAVVRLLAGDSVAALTESAKQYASILLETRRVESVWSLIDEPSRTGSVLLASASLEPVVACLATAIGARHVASQLEERNGILTGRYTKDVTGQKEQAIRDKYGSNILNNPYFAISDNYSDCLLLKNAKLAYVVLHRQEHKQRWLNLAPIFLDITT